MKPILHLLGDRYKAQQFVRFAERKLAEMKQIMKLQRLKMQNRLIRFTTDSVEVYIESYHGMDKIRIRVALPEEGIFGQLASSLPSIQILGSGIEWYSVGVWLFGNGRANMNVKIWDSSGTEMWSSQTHNLGSSGAYFVSIPLTTILGTAQYYTIFSNSNEDYYYGIEFEYISGSISILSHVSGDLAYKGDSGGTFWSVADAGVLAGFLRKPSSLSSFSLSWVGSSPDSPYVSIFNVFINYFIIAHSLVPFPINIGFVVSSSSITNTKIACKVEHDSIIQAGFDTGQTVLR